MADVSISLTVNGEHHEVKADESEPLLYVLRDRLNLKAARYGCGQGTCGACTVLVDGRAQMSCNVPISTLDGALVTTAEALDCDPPGPLLRAFLDHQAGQCGYCLPGILMRASDLLENTPLANRDQIAEALDVHLCRCGAHVRILDAIETAQRDMAKGTP